MISRCKPLLRWFASATNGIEKMFARSLETRELCIVDDFGGRTCLTKKEIDDLMRDKALIHPSTGEVVSQGKQEEYLQDTLEQEVSQGEALSENSEGEIVESTSIEN